MKKIITYHTEGFNGYIKDGNLVIGPETNSPKWRLDEDCEESFQFIDLDGFYNEDYFKDDHVPDFIANNYVLYVLHYFKEISGKDLKSVLEIGSAGGWFTKKFMDYGLEILGVEGSECGYRACLERGLSESQILKKDFRNPIKLDKKYDIVCCTEVAEHIEIPFSGTLIKTLTDNSDMVWFSSVSPGLLGIPPTYDHCNEQPDKFWINLFDFFNYGYIKLSDEVYNNTHLRGRYVFYNRNVYNVEGESSQKEYKKINHFYQNIGEDWFGHSNFYSEIVNKFPDGSHFVEVGVWKGRGASYMGVEINNSGKNIKFDCVDTWEYIDSQNDISKDSYENLYDIFLKNIEPVKHIINPVKLLSTDAAKKYEDNSLDFVFVDAAHDYTNVKNDIEAWFPKIKVGGIIAGHDYNTSIDGVKKAVDEFFNEKNIINKENCWIYEKIK